MRGLPRSTYDLARVRGFSDAVFAVAITLVVAAFRLPSDPTLSRVGIDAFLEDRWAIYAGFIAGFVVVGYYWLSHHQLFELVVRCDGRMVGLNFGLLFFVVLLPFSTRILGEYRQFAAAYVMFNALVLLLGVSNAVLWSYALRAPRQVSRDLDERALLIYRLRAAWLPFVFALSLIFSLRASGDGTPWWAVSCWALLPLGHPLTSVVFGRIPLSEVAAEDNEIDDPLASGEPVVPAPPARDAGTRALRIARRRDGTLPARLHSTASMGRLISFSDNVYAFAITLLVARFPLPPTATTATNADLSRAVINLTGPYFTPFTLSFCAIAVFWTLHHRQFLVIDRQDGALRVLNLVHLMTIAVLPFSTDLFSSFADEPLSYAIYAATLGLCLVTLALMRVYAARQPRLIDDRRRAESARGTVRGRV